MITVKPGVRTTEFWATVGSNFVIGGTTAVEALVQTVPEDQLTYRLLLMGGINALYGLSRAIAKLGKREQPESPVATVREGSSSDA
jgi:hypothetical protein